MVDTVIFFFFNDTATTEIYTLSLHDALPISALGMKEIRLWARTLAAGDGGGWTQAERGARPAQAVLLPEERSEEHTSGLQSRSDLGCRLLLEKKKKSDLRY